MSVWKPFTSTSPGNPNHSSGIISSWENVLLTFSLSSTEALTSIHIMVASSFQKNMAIEVAGREQACLEMLEAAAGNLKGMMVAACLNCRKRSTTYYKCLRGYELVLSFLFPQSKMSNSSSC